MSIAVFGRKVFEITQNKIYTFDSLQYGSSLNTEKQDADGKKPSTYNKGPGLNSMSVKVILDASLGVNPRREIEEWESIKDEAIAYQFILGNRPFGRNKWLLVDIQTTAQVIDNTGNILLAELSLKFDEYVRPGSAETSEMQTYTPGIQLPAISGSNILGSTSNTKIAYKRNNPYMVLY